MLSEMFNGRTLNKSINPDEAVAYGAAVQAAILTGEGSEQTGQLLLLDVAALSMGIETTGGIMTNVINRNTPTPCKKSKMFTTDGDYQTEIDCRIFEGERKITKDNHELGFFLLEGIPAMKEGEAKIEVTF